VRATECVGLTRNVYRSQGVVPNMSVVLDSSTPNSEGCGFVRAFECDVLTKKVYRSAGTVPNAYNELASSTPNSYDCGWRCTTGEIRHLRMTIANPDADEDIDKKPAREYLTNICRVPLAGGASIQDGGQATSPSPSTATSLESYFQSLGLPIAPFPDSFRESTKHMSIATQQTHFVNYALATYYLNPLYPLVDDIILVKYAYYIVGKIHRNRPLATRLGLGGVLKTYACNADLNERTIKFAQEKGDINNRGAYTCHDTNPSPSSTQYNQSYLNDAAEDHFLI
jgi:hypothetical protein